MAQTVKKNIELNLSGDIIRSLTQLRHHLERIDIMMSNKEKTQGEINRLLGLANGRYRQQLNDLNAINKTTKETNEAEKKKTAELEKQAKIRADLMERVSQYKPSRGIIGQSLGAWQSSLQGRIKATEKTKEGISASLAEEAGSFEAISGVVGTVASGFNALGIVLSPVIRGFHTLEQQIENNVKALISMQTGLATYSSSTLITNATARSTRLQWGLSASQYAGYAQAANLLGVQNEEDLYYMNSDQRNLFMNYMKKYSAYYDKVESSGVLRNIQQMQLDLAEFKTEMSYEFLSWVSDNRDAIMGTLNVIMEGVLAIGKFAKAIFNKMGLSSNNGVYSPSSLYNNTISADEDSWKAAEKESELRNAGFQLQS